MHQNMVFMGWCIVAPLAGAWIEISQLSQFMDQNNVAPLAGAWIEIYRTEESPHHQETSLPSRERGLKSAEFRFSAFSARVAPLAGAWIEIFNLR